MESSEGILLESGSYAVRAVYTKEKLPEYQGNPLIESLPPILDNEQVHSLLVSKPTYSEEERKLEQHIRLHCVQRLFAVFQPLDKQFDLEQRISAAIRQGYISRNPFSPDFGRKLQANYVMLKQGKFICSNHPSNNRNNASGFTIIGISGIGKTAALNRILAGYPQIIAHSKFDNQPLSLYQLSWLKIDCPHDGSTKALCINFFRLIDRLLGTSYYAKHATKRNTAANSLLPVMAQIAFDHALGLLVIDEIQHLSQAKSGGAEEMLNFFVTLVNTIGVPVILVGTNKAMPILQREFRQARRGSGQGDMIWERMQNDGLWEILVKAIWPYQWTKTKTALTDELMETLYEESQGITDIAIKLYAISQLRAISLGGCEVISSGLIRAVAKDSLQLVRPMIEALKSGELNEIVKYPDIQPIDYEKFYQQYIGILESRFPKKEIVQNSGSNLNQSISTQVISELLKLKISPEVAIKSVEEAIGRISSEDVSTLVIEAFKIAVGVNNTVSAKEEKPKKKPKPPKQKENLIDNTNDLRFIFAHSKTCGRPTYEKLFERGYIKNPANEFLIR